MTNHQKVLSLLASCLLACHAGAQDSEFLYFGEFVGSQDLRISDDIGVLDLGGRTLDRPFSAIATDGIVDLAHVDGSDLLWFSEPGQTGEANALNVRTGAIELSIATDGTDGVQLALSPDGQVVYVLEDALRIRAYRTTDGERLASGVARNGFALSSSPNGDEVYWLARCCELPTLHVLDAVTLSPTRRVALPGPPASLKLSADGSTAVMVSRTMPQIMTVDLSAYTVSTLPVSNGQPDNAVLSPDGGVAYVATRGGGVELIDTSSGVSLGTIAPGTVVRGLEVSADGARLYFATPNSVQVADTQTLNTLFSRQTNGTPGPLVVGSVPRDPAGLLRGMNIRAGTCQNLPTLDSTSISEPGQQWRCPLDALSSMPGTPLRVDLFGVVTSHRQAYLPSTYDESMYVVALAEEQVVDRVPIGGGSLATQVNQAAGEVYVASTESQDVWVFDAQTHALLARIPTGGTPARMALELESQRLWVSNVDTNEIVLIDVTTRAVEATVAVGESPRTIVFSPDGTLAYVAQMSATQSVAVIDTLTLLVTDTIQFGFAIENLEISKDGTRLYALDNENGAVTVYSLEAGAQVASENSSPNMFGVRESLDGENLWVTNAFGDIDTYLTDPFEPIWFGSGGGSKRELRQDPATELLYISDYGAGRLRIASGPSVQSSLLIGNLTEAWGEFVSGAVRSSIAGLVDNARALQSFRCRNVLSGQTVSSTVAPGTRRWDCTALGLEAALGDPVSITLVIRSD